MKRVYLNVFIDIYTCDYAVEWGGGGIQAVKKLPSRWIVLKTTERKVK